MPGLVIPVAPGVSPTQLTGTTQPNFTIYNLDPVNAVWISDSRAVAPNNGMRLGPLANMEWTGPTGDAFACVDTGVATAVKLNISDDVENVNSPVDVATAVATALLAQGVPNVLVSSTLINQTLHANDIVTIDVSGQASITLEVAVANSGVTGNIVLDCLFFDPAGGTAANFYLTVPYDSNTGAYGQWEIPVTGKSFRVISSAGNPNCGLLIGGSNRPVPKLHQLVNSILPRKLQAFGAFVANTPFPLTFIDGIGENVTRFNGPCKLSCNAASATRTAGYILTASYVPQNGAGAGALNTISQSVTINNDVVLDFYHPSVPLTWQVVPVGAVASGQVILTVTPAGPGL